MISSNLKKEEEGQRDLGGMGRQRAAFVDLCGVISCNIEGEGHLASVSKKQ